MVVTGKCTDVELLKEMMCLQYTDANLYIFEKAGLIMNLKRLEDALDYSTRSGWVYTSYKSENKSVWRGLRLFGSGNVSCQNDLAIDDGSVCLLSIMR